MRTATGLIVGAVLAWCWLAIWRGPTRWLLYRIPPATHPDHVDRVRTFRHGVEVFPATWPTEESPDGRTQEHATAAQAA